MASALRHRLARDEVRHDQRLGQERIARRIDINTLITLNGVVPVNDFPVQVAVLATRDIPASRRSGSDFGSYADGR